MEVFIIGGKSGSGKGEVAKIIAEYFKDKKCIKTQFSKYLKMYAKEIVGFDETKEKPRDFLQDIGNKIRENNRLFLINRMIEDIKVYESYFDIIIIDDARLPEEITILKEKFPSITSFYIKNCFGKSHLTKQQQQDITETALDDSHCFDYTINNKDLNDTKKEIFDILSRRRVK